MAFLKNVFIVLFAVTVIPHKLNAMEEKALTAILEETAASDFQIYQLLSAATKPGSPLYLPVEVTKIIAMNAYEISAECYQKYGECLGDPYTVLTFIRKSFKETMSHMIIVNILKTCLSYRGKSLSEFKFSGGNTVFHYMMGLVSIRDNLECAKIICLVAGNQAWDLIKMKDDLDRTVLHRASCASVLVIKELLRIAPSPEEAWKLINAQNSWGETALSIAARHTPFSLAGKQQNEEIIEILESYRPK